jgi:hypothetical protein
LMLCDACEDAFFASPKRTRNLVTCCANSSPGRRRITPPEHRVEARHDKLQSDFARFFD